MKGRAKRRGRSTGWSIGGLVLIGGAILGWWYLGKGEVSIDPARLVKVEQGMIARSVVATGRVEPITKVEIKSKANGIIKSLQVRVGERVRPGQILAELDKEDLAARLREAEAGLQAAESNFTAARAQLAKHEVEAEGPDLPFTRQNLERSERLHREGVLPQQSLEDARNSHELALNRQKIALAQLGVSEARIGQALAEVAQARALVDRAREELTFATIRSPIEGVVLSRDIELGSPVSSILNLGAAATLVMVLGDVREVYVRGKVDEADIGQVKIGLPSRIRVETFRDRVFQGRVTEIVPLGVNLDNVVTFEVWVSIENPGGVLLPNMTANAEIVLEERTETLLLPEAAIRYTSQRAPYVELPPQGAKGQSTSVPIELGISNGTRTEVLRGLSLGQEILMP
jgi:HlyD family secretion protein